MTRQRRMSSVLAQNIPKLNNFGMLAFVALVGQAWEVGQAEVEAKQCLWMPPSWESCVLYYNSFSDTEGRAQVDAESLSLPTELVTGSGGILGRCARSEERQALVLKGEALSPHQPLAVSFWWSMQTRPAENSGYGLFHLTNGRGIVSLFARGGPWCSLKRTAGVFQVYYFEGIVDVNGLYDRALFDHLDVSPGVWHHTAVVLTAASRVQAYVDGREVFQVRLKGRNFRASDNIHELSLGSRHGGSPMALDEVMVLNWPLLAGEIAEYVSAVRQARAVGYHGVK